MQHFNKVIDLTLYSSDDSFKIETPRTGVKPSITIKGKLSTQTEVTGFDITIKNLYTNKILSEYHKIKITAGYENRLKTVIDGSIANIYTASPGPDKETVIQCDVADYDKWLNATVNVNLTPPVMLKNAIARMVESLGFQGSYIDPVLYTKTSPAGLCINGDVRTGIAHIKHLFPDVDITVESNMLYVIPKDKVTLRKTYHLPYLTQAPQFSGTQVILMSQWDPMVRPGDYITFPLYSSFQTSRRGVDNITNMAVVRSVDFAFSTTGSQNEMMITATTGAN